MINISKVTRFLRIMDLLFCIAMISLAAYSFFIEKDILMSAVYLAFFLFNAYLTYINLNQRVFTNIIIKKSFREQS